MANWNLDVTDGGIEVLVEASWEATAANEAQSPTTVVDVSTLKKHKFGGDCNGLIIKEVWLSTNGGDTNFASDHEGTYLLDSANTVIENVSRFNDGYNDYTCVGGLKNTNDYHKGNNTGNTGNGDLRVSFGVGNPANPGNVQLGSFYKLKLRATKTFDIS